MTAELTSSACDTNCRRELEPRHDDGSGSRENRRFVLILLMSTNAFRAGRGPPLRPSADGEAPTRAALFKWHVSQQRPQADMAPSASGNDEGIQSIQSNCMALYNTR